MTVPIRKPRTIRVLLDYDADRMERKLVEYAVKEKLLRPSAKDKNGSIMRVALAQLYRTFFASAGRDGG